MSSTVITLLNGNGKVELFVFLIKHAKDYAEGNEP